MIIMVMLVTNLHLDQVLVMMIYLEGLVGSALRIFLVVEEEGARALLKAKIIGIGFLYLLLIL